MKSTYIILSKCGIHTSQTVKATKEKEKAEINNLNLKKVSPLTKISYKVEDMLLKRSTT